MQILFCVKFYDARARHAWKALDEPVKFWVQESWKAGAGKLGLSNFRSWKAGDAPENLHFWRIYVIIKG